MALRCDGCRETASRTNPLLKIVEIDMRPDSPMHNQPVLLDLHVACIGIRVSNRSGIAYMKVKPAEVQK